MSKKDSDFNLDDLRIPDDLLRPVPVDSGPVAEVKIARQPPPAREYREDSYPRPPRWWIDAIPGGAIFKVMHSIHDRYHKEHCKPVTFTEKQCAEIGVSGRTGARAIAQLIDLGIIAKTAVQPGKPTTYIPVWWKGVIWHLKV